MSKTIDKTIHWFFVFGVSITFAFELGEWLRAVLDQADFGYILEQFNDVGSTLFMIGFLVLLDRYVIPDLEGRLTIVKKEDAT